VALLAMALAFVWSGHRGEIPERAVGLSRGGWEEIATRGWVASFWSWVDDFRSRPKITTYIGPLLDCVFFLVFRFLAVFRNNNSV
jgi:hypothetical protein